MAGKKYRKVRKKSSYVSKGTGSKIVHTGYGSVAKKRIVRGKPKTNLYKDTRKLVSQTNARLSSLQRRFKKGTWASKTLYNKLGTKKINIGKKGKLSLPKNLNKTELTAINKALSQFLRSKSSTKKGISEIRKKQIENVRERLSVDAEEMSYDEAEAFYEMFGDEDFQGLTDKIAASALQACIDDAIEAGDTENQFIDRLTLYSGVEMNDLDMREKAIALYEKYVM